MSDLVAGHTAKPLRADGLLRFWHDMHARLRAVAAHPDPLAEASNWAALTVGTHLPFWPLYVLWAAGPEAMPAALLTAAMTPAFLAVPLITRHSSLLGRIAMVAFGLINTIFTVWILGAASGTELFLAPCAALAALIFRHGERCVMLVLTSLPLGVWCLLQKYPQAGLFFYDAAAAQNLLALNVFSIATLMVLFGWFQAGIYRKLEAIA